MFSLRRALLIPLVLASGCINTPPPSERALVNNELCVQELSRGNCKQAEVYCDLGLEFAPQYGDLWNNKGLIGMCMKDVKAAKEAFIKSIRFNSEQASAYTNLGKIYVDEKSYGKAHDMFQRALKVNPDYVEARYNLALTYINLDKMDQAEKELLTLLAVDPNNAQVHHDLGLVKYRQDAKSTAEQEMVRAVQLAPTLRAEWWNDLGAVQMELSHFVDAVQSFGSCVALENDNATCMNNLGIAQRKAALTNAGFKELVDTNKIENTPENHLKVAERYIDQGLLKNAEESYKDCLKVDGKYPACHFGLFQLYSEAHQAKAAQIACKNFVKYAGVDQFPKELATCEKFLNAQSY